MDETTLIKALGSAPGGVALAAALVLVLYKVLSKVAERWIAALDRVATSVQEHTKIDIEHHADVKEAVVRVEAKLDEAISYRHRSDAFDRVEPEREREREHTPQSITRPMAVASEQSERRRKKHRAPG